MAGMILSCASILRFFEHESIGCSIYDGYNFHTGTGLRVSEKPTEGDLVISRCWDTDISLEIRNWAVAGSIS